MSYRHVAGYLMLGAPLVCLFAFVVSVLGIEKAVAAFGFATTFSAMVITGAHLAIRGRWPWQS